MQVRCGKGAQVHHQYPEATLAHVDDSRRSRAASCVMPPAPGSWNHGTTDDSKM